MWGFFAVCFLCPLLLEYDYTERGRKKEKKNKSYKMVIIHTQCQGKHFEVTLQFSIVKPLALAGELKEDNSIKNNSEFFLTQLLGWNVS